MYKFSKANLQMNDANKGTHIQSTTGIDHQLAAHNRPLGINTANFTETTTTNDHDG
jgi:hypothetical protein